MLIRHFQSIPFLLKIFNQLLQIFGLFYCLFCLFCVHLPTLGASVEIALIAALSLERMTAKATFNLDHIIGMLDTA